MCYQGEKVTILWMYACLYVCRYASMYVWMYEARLFPLVAHLFPLNAQKARKRAFKGKRCATKGKKLLSYVCMHINKYIYVCRYASMYGCMKRSFFPLGCTSFPLERAKSQKACIQGEKMCYQGEKVIILCMYACIYVCMYVCMNMYVSMYVSKYVCCIYMYI